ncbi:hypothetical protein acdb102_16810 [Acidothermaceae bacterium B102]|nr:hypothetical protein acdb102_16810 [Acidothermaceae bacterium B102]
MLATAFSAGLSVGDWPAVIAHTQVGPSACIGRIRIVIGPATAGLLRLECS